MNAKHSIIAFGIGIALSLASVDVHGQGEGGAPNRPTAPRPWPPEKLSDGQPDVQGIWAAVNGGSTSLPNPISGGEDFDRRLTGENIRRPSRIIDPPHGPLPDPPRAGPRRAAAA